MAPLSNPRLHVCQAQASPPAPVFPCLWISCFWTLNRNRVLPHVDFCDQPVTYVTIPLESQSTAWTDHSLLIRALVDIGAVAAFWLL